MAINPGSYEYKKFIGNDFEQAYAEVFHTNVEGGFRDGGKDIKTGIDDIPYIQVKASWDGAMHFLSKGLKFASDKTRGRYVYIPICVGEPGTKEEIIESIKEYGGWIGKDVPQREENLLKLQKARDHIINIRK